MPFIAMYLPRTFPLRPMLKSALVLILSVMVSGCSRAGTVEAGSTNSTPKPVVERLHTEVVKAAQDAGYRQAMTNIGVEATSSTPEEFAGFLRTETAKWGRVVQATGTKVD